MSGESNALKDQAAALNALADEIEELLDGGRRQLGSMISGHLFAGPIATETGEGLNDSRRRLQTAAQLLRDEALTRRKEADRIENTDSAWTDVGDFVTGRDFTPWS